MCLIYTESPGEAATDILIQVFDRHLFCSISPFLNSTYPRLRLQLLLSEEVLFKSLEDYVSHVKKRGV